MADRQRRLLFGAEIRCSVRARRKTTLASRAIHDSMKAALVQLSSQADVSANMQKVERLVRQAHGLGARLVCLPEGFAFLGQEKERKLVAEQLPNGVIGTVLGSLSRELDLFILAGGMPVQAPDENRPYNASVLFAPSGNVVAQYCKMHLFDVDLDDGTRLCESDGSTAGRQVVVTEVDGIKVGLSICYDLRFPAVFQRQRELGAQVLTVPAAFTHSTGQAHWHALLRARAIETQCYVLAPAQFGQHPFGRHTYGHSLIISPWGEMLVEQTEGEGIIQWDLDMAVVDAVRRQMPVFQHRVSI